MYSFGQLSRGIIEDSRDRIAKSLGCDNTEIFFTSGSSEGNAFALSDAIIQFQIPIESPVKMRSVYFGQKVEPFTSFSRVNITSSTNSIMLVTAYARIVSGRIICIGELGSAAGYQNNTIFAIENGYAKIPADSISAVCAFTYNDAFPEGSKLIIRGIRKK